MEDSELLQEFAENNSDEAFAALVTRHVNLVFSVALRQVGNPHHAEEITQAVFIILAKKAARVRHHRALSSWLFQTTRLTASNFLRSETRRLRREQEAYMHSVLNESANDAWPKVAPMLDSAVANLSEKERQAILLRFYECKNLREVGNLLQINEGAAEKRVSRALEKLRKFFAKRGVSSTTAIIAGMISANSIQAAPAGLTKIISAATAKGTAVSGSTLVLVKGALKIMAYTKTKTAIMIATGVLLAAGIITIGIKRIENFIATNPDRWRAANFNLRMLEQAPPQVRILPSTFSGAGRRGLRGSGNGSDRKMAGLGFGIPAIFAAAYGRNDARIIFSAKAPTNRYDFICTLTSRQGEALQNELLKAFGLAGKIQMRETDVLLLTLKDPKGPGLWSSAVPRNAPASLQGQGRGHLSGQNVTLANLANDLEQRLSIPVVDQTGAENGRFDFELTWNQSDPMLNLVAFKQALSDELGLELIPAKKSTEVVVVDSAKRQEPQRPKQL
jgi:uncharacterized protein (TIGR03435 family)